MLISILSDIQYLQEVFLSFEEGSNVQNHCSHHPIKNSPPVKFMIPPNTLTIFGKPFFRNGGTLCLSKTSINF